MLLLFFSGVLELYLTIHYVNMKICNNLLQFIIIYTNMSSCMFNNIQHTVIIMNLFVFGHAISKHIETYTFFYICSFLLIYNMPDIGRDSDIFY